MAESTFEPCLAMHPLHVRSQRAGYRTRKAAPLTQILRPSVFFRTVVIKTALGGSNKLTLVTWVA